MCNQIMAIMQHNELNKFNISDTERKHGGRRLDVTLPPFREEPKRDLPSETEEQQRNFESAVPLFIFHFLSSAEKSLMGCFIRLLRTLCFNNLIFQVQPADFRKKRY